MKNYLRIELFGYSIRRLSLKGAKPLKLGEIYGALMIALSCLCGAINNWENSILVCILGLGVVCGTIVILDIRRAKKEKHIIK